MRIIKIQHTSILATVSIVVLSVSFACKNSGKREVGNGLNDYKEVKATKVTINFNQSFFIKEIKSGQSMSDIFISGTGFPNSNNTLTFSKTAPLESFWVADLDGNGYEELYLITRSVGAGSKAFIIGVASMEGKAYKAIFNPENESTNKEKLSYLEGYHGYDSIYFNKNKLYRQFPVNGNCSPKNSVEPISKRIVTYRLVLYNNAYSLQIDTISNNPSNS